MLLHQNLSFGGAEMLVIEIAVGLKKRGHDVMVVTFYDNNPLGVRLTEAGVALECLYKQGRWDVLVFMWRFLNAVRRFRPDVIYTLMPIPNLVALVGRLAKPGLKLIGGVSIARLDLRPFDRVTRVSYWLEARLTRFTDLVIANSRAGFDDAISRGFSQTVMRMVPTGVDTVRYCPDPAARRRLRSEWGVADGDRLIGLIGRLDPQKDIPTFLAAAAKLASSMDRLRFVVVGDGPTAYRASLVAQCEQLGISARTLWVPVRADIEAVYNALDLMVVSAVADGLSIALVQALACGTSAVVTEAGDNGSAIGAWGQLVPPRDPAALADAVKLQLQRLVADGDAIAAGCRRHILKNFSVETMVSNTEALMFSLSAPSR
jgi:glycosyltransferase involved in cell wall biosynthesis